MQYPVGDAAQHRREHLDGVLADFFDGGGAAQRGVELAPLRDAAEIAYDLARERSCKLLFIGNDFSNTDIPGVL